ncbi:MAG: hypothetical protein NC218_07965 [Acetobacter sp.]|nr:hypothetical protein [Acetobacter sp.]
MAAVVAAPPATVPAARETKGLWCGVGDPLTAVSQPRDDTEKRVWICFF